MTRVHRYGGYYIKNIKNQCKGRPGQAQTHIYTSACASGDASLGGGEGERVFERFIVFGRIQSEALSSMFNVADECASAGSLG